MALIYGRSVPRRNFGCGDPHRPWSFLFDEQTIWPPKMIDQELQFNAARRLHEGPVKLADLVVSEVLAEGNNK